MFSSIQKRSGKQESLFPLFPISEGDLALTC